MRKKGVSIEQLIEDVLIENSKYERIKGNWLWVNLGTVCDFKRGPFGSAIKKSMFVPKSSDSYKVYEQGNAIRKNIDYGNYYISQDDFVNLKGFEVNSGDIIVSCAGTIGETYIIPTDYERGVINQALMRVRVTNALDTEYFLYAFDHSVKQLAKDNAKGTAMKNLPPLSELKQYRIPLPPLKEQKRITAKLKCLLGKIEEAKQLIEEVKETFESRRIALLDKAFRGELTKKWREENLSIESAESRLEKIKKERLEIADNNREITEISRMYSEFNTDEHINSFGWLYLKANMFCHNINCGGTPSKDITEVGEIPFLKVYNIINNKIAFSYKSQYIPREVHESKLKKSILKSNDVIMNIVGPPLKKIAIIPEEFPEMNMNQAIVRFRPIKSVLPKYLYYCLQYDETLREVLNETKGVVGQANISVSQSRNLVMPIPSLAEQTIIVNKLEELIEKEEIALELISNDETLENLKQSILSKAFRGELGTNDPSEENAIEILKEVLQK